MKFTVLKSVLMDKLTPAMGSVSNKNTVTTLEGVLLETLDNGDIRISSYDMNKGIRATFTPSDVERTGSFIVNAQRFYQTIKVLPEQEITVDINDNLNCTISSGKAGKDTPKGVFPIISKDEDHISSTYGSIVDADGNTLVANYTKGEPIPPGGIYKGAPMTNGMQLTWGGIWMHEGLVTSAPESHGCIRLPKRMAKIFFDNTPVGTPVEIK